MIENAWEAASDQEYIWNLVHRLEDQYTPEELRSMKKWYNRPASELIFCKGEKVNEEYTDN